MAVITVADVELYLNRSLDEDELDAASQLILNIQAELEGPVLGNRPLEITEFEEELFLSSWGSVVYPTFGPVRVVSSVVVDGLARQAGSYVIFASSVDLGYAGAGVSGRSTVSLTYEAGLGEPAVSAVKQIMLDRIARALNKRKDDAIGSPSVDGQSYQDDGFTDYELARVSRYKKRVAV